MTSIEWLIEELTPSIALQQKYIDELKDKAKEMHKVEIIDAYNQGDYDVYNGKSYITAEQYYQETFGSKGSDVTSSQTTSDKWKEYQDWLNEPPEISDEEIEKGAKEWYNKEGAYSASAIALKTWVYAIRWYREQLKNKKD
jgi:uncharacterized protein YnzC (UPF0291/DUF896 family)